MTNREAEGARREGNGEWRMANGECGVRIPHSAFRIPHWRAGGFTLIELLVVMFILGLLAAIVVPKYVGHVGKSKQQAAQAQIEIFGTVLDTFRLDVGRYPTTEEGLEALRKAPSTVGNWNGPYLPREIPKDPWDNAYVYKSPGEHGEYDLISYGADKAPGGEGENKDIVSWKGLGQ